jgi:hypothetical protein
MAGFQVTLRGRIWVTAEDCRWHDSFAGRKYWRLDELADNVARCVGDGACANVHISSLHLYNQNEQGNRIAGADSR